MFDLSNGMDIFNFKRIFLISWHLYLLQINKALNFEVFILLQKTPENRHPKFNWSKRRYHSTRFESQAIHVKRIEQKKGGGRGNTTVFFIFYFMAIVPKSTQFYVEKKWKLYNRHYYICLCTWLKVHSSYTNDFRNWTKQMTLLSVTQCISKCLIIFQQLAFESFRNFLWNIQTYEIYE